ncbi:hypothetical protein NDU88_003096 [Pleurodeles waltl]|uniref:Uncharacterized protein n=1 Tax=Pleurodeles waltl TaxID=8319 RepID=A0AAV7P8N8_PLEWA|nr:hypothetical protein NDU88_003096 [Pleurodeles waltl]
MAWGRRLVSHVSRALRDDLPSTPLQVQTCWEVVVPEPLSDKDCEKIHTGHPGHAAWLRDVNEWAVAEELRMKRMRTDKIVDDLRAWEGMLHAMNHQLEDLPPSS